MKPFDPVNNETHRQLLDKLLARYYRDHPEARNATVDHIDATRHVVVLREKTAAMITGEGDARTVTLPDEFNTPAKGEKAAVWVKTNCPGFTMTAYHPYEGTAEAMRLDARTITVRNILADNLSVKPWQLDVTPTEDHGWSVRLKDGVIWNPAKMEKGMEQACRLIGGDGWWYERDRQHERLIVHPGQPAVFQPVHPYPFTLLGEPERLQTRTPFGVYLPRTGGDPYEMACVDWKQGSFLLVGGEGGSGKSVLVNNLIAGLIAAGIIPCIVDLKNKSTDYYWCRPWVHWWGCESIVQAAGVVNRFVWEAEHGERGQAWAENGWQNWYDIPAWAKRKYPRYCLILDEFSSLTDEAVKVSSIPKAEKTPPPILEALFKGQAEQDIKANATRLLRTARAQGYLMILISQTVSQSSGLPPNTRDLFSNRIGQGSNPSEGLVKGVFHDLAGLPDFPPRLLDGVNAKGLGRVELAGERARIFKTFWAGHDGMSDTEALAHALVDYVGVPDDIDAPRFLDTLRKHGPDEPVDVEYMNYLTDRISMSYEDALHTDTMLPLLRDALQESRDVFGETAMNPSGNTETQSDTNTPVNDVPGGGADADSGVKLLNADALVGLLK